MGIIRKQTHEDCLTIPKIRDGATIKVHPETRDRLKAAKRGGESYDDLFNRLLDGVRDAV